ncbi:ExbD/TolR family protein [Roseovarius sp. ZX-A-9]|uniref:ExbD/TolR family protein n=1 Tax=Roseovarius sp. ZX-A-9 TaxID=3014783 RepID=UPI00232D96B7|nr:biopolymer transporter ExbD [Roseovarius sp. ZX-A-9]
MQFPDPPRRKLPESIVPMINVVFLLLIFFLMTAQIAPPEPFDVTPPDVTGDGAPADGAFTLYLSRDGALAFGENMDEEAALAALEAAKDSYCQIEGCSDRGEQPRLVLRADAHVSGARLAGLMPRIAQAGFPEIQLVTVSE